MKKNTFYNLLNLILVATYVVSLIIQRNFPFLDISLSNYWFPTFCIFVSISMLFKSIIFKSDSSLWLFVCLLLLGVLILCFHYFNFDLVKYWPIVISVIAFSSLVVGLVFREIYQVKVCLVLSLISIPLYLFSFKVIGVWWFIGVLLLSIWTSIFATRFLPERWYFKNQKHKY